MVEIKRVAQYSEPMRLIDASIKSAVEFGIGEFNLNPVAQLSNFEFVEPKLLLRFPRFHPAASNSALILRAFLGSYQCRHEAASPGTEFLPRFWNLHRSVTMKATTSSRVREAGFRQLLSLPHPPKLEC